MSKNVGWCDDGMAASPLNTEQIRLTQARSRQGLEKLFPDRVSQTALTCRYPVLLESTFYRLCTSLSNSVFFVLSELSTQFRARQGSVTP